MHPLTPDLTNLTDEELVNKRTELQNRLSYAYRIGNADLTQQLNMLTQDYTWEIERRNQKMLNDMRRPAQGNTTQDTVKNITT
jgi:hypothetical protein